MEQQLLIKTQPGDWNKSMIYPVGVLRDGKIVNPGTLKIQPIDFPKPFDSIWDGMLQAFIAAGDNDGGRKCVTLEIIKRVLPPATYDGEERTELEITSSWQWEDGREMPDETLVIADSNVIALFDWLASDRKAPQP